jgi:OOP family OmpA-OmpF porin
MRKLLFFLPIHFLFCGISMAQYPLISHMDWMQAQYNPAFVGVNGYENVLLDYNRSWMSKEVSSSIARLQYDRAIILSNGFNIGGIGASIVNNRVNYKNRFNRFQASLAASSAFNLNEEVMLNFGIQGTLFDDRVNNNSLLTGSQYVPGWGFDPSISNSEPVNEERAGYIGVSAGAFIYQLTDDHLPSDYLGFSVRNINRPVNAFVQENARLEPQYNLMGGTKLIEGVTNKLLGEAWYSNSSGQGNLTLGVVYQENRLISSRSSDENISLRILSRYSINNKLLAGGQMILDRFVVGFTYDIPLPNSVERTYDSGFEVLLALRQKVRTPKKKEKKKKSKYVPESRKIPKAVEIEERDSLVVENEVVKADLPDTTTTDSAIDGQAMAGDLIADEPGELYIYFDFSSKEITDNSETILQNFVADFFRQQKSIVVVTGHTDNVGTVQFNEKLSLRRAYAVRDRLMALGLQSEQIQVKAAGELKPLVPNDTDGNRAINRRVEIRFY